MSASFRLFRKIRASIGVKIFGAFVVMSLITGAIGSYGIYELFTTADIVVDTFDGSLMAINYARSASATFALIDRDELLRRQAEPDRSGEIESKIEDLMDSLMGDLGVARERVRTVQAARLVDQIKAEVSAWESRRRGDEAAPGRFDLLSASAAILDHFDELTEFIADHAFVARREAVWSISYLKYTAFAALAAALVAGILIAYVLRRRIIRPLTAAADVADRISHGHLDTEIPDGGSDETGVLLRSMRLMRDAIAAAMEHEAAQRRSAQARLVDALESSQEGMALVGADGRAIIANTEFTRLFPSFTEEARQGPDFIGAFAAVYPQWRDMLAAGGELQVEDGRWLQCTRTPTRDGGFFLFFSDVTAIKQREESFKQAKLLAEAASNAKNAFLTNMSHELRTPLNAIIGFSEVMAGGSFGPLGNARYENYVGDVLTCGRHLLDIINNVLNLSKSEAGSLSLNYDPVDMATVLSNCANLIRPQCEAKKVTLRTDWPDEDVVIEGDVTKLRQIILNLLSNAVKFTYGGGSIWLLARHGAEDRLEIQVVDTGIGIAPENIPLALTPFGQIDSGLSREFEGTGMGLPLCKIFVELHHGKLTIDSVLDVGTAVTVSLPKRLSQVRALSATAAA
jgi:signal transduction histidine kinase/HAMP domain-containing protein